MIICLTGFMGSGKSSVGRELQKLLHLEFVDLDIYIEQKSGRRIPDIFRQDGEKAFRKMELQALADVLGSKDKIVLSLGGGTLTTPACVQMVKDNTTCFYLRATVDTLLANLKDAAVNRPMLQTKEQKLRERIEFLMSQRSSVYESTADAIIDVDGDSFSETAAKIADYLKNIPES